MSPFIAVGIPQHDLINYQHRNQKVPYMSIIKTVADAYQVSWMNLLGPVRKREYSEPRQIAIYMIRTNSKLTSTEIGRIFSRDHSTILYAIETVCALIDTDSGYRSRFNSIHQQLFS